ncbi:hypothetical protein A1D31_23600 [Bradyrhizobium liaoningense]|nr:hypothetical protein A1D31_23600 [Bradyrhizobium liaoningense]
MCGAELLHLSGSIVDLVYGERGSFFVQNNSLSGIVNQNMSRDRLFGYEFELAMRKVLVGNDTIIQECGFGVGRTSLL